MKLNSTGPLARFYEWSYVGQLPNNLCAYFWKLVVAFLFLPFTWATFWVKDSDFPFFLRIVGGGILQAFLVVLLVIFINPFYGNWKPLAGFAIGVCGVLIVVGIITLVENSKLAVPKVVSEFASLSYERSKAVKDNYCPRIEWGQD